MRVAIVGQKDFGKAVLEAFAARGDAIVGVFSAPQRCAEATDPLVLSAEQSNIRVLKLPSLRSAEACDALRAMQADIAVLAYVLQFVPQEFARIPKHGTIQFHPSLLPRYRGPSSINWPLILGDQETGLTIFRPTDGLDEGPVILQKHTAIGPDETCGGIYFERLFPMGVAALLEAATRVVEGGAMESAQDETLASYQGWCREQEARINWHTHVDPLYNLIRGCNPAPGAWTLWQGARLQIFDARKHPARTLAQARGKVGTIAAIGEKSMTVVAQGGQIEVLRVRAQGGKKMSAAQFCAEANISLGTLLGT